jgi:tetratricopeptide (TPR) repeat protein
MSEAESAIQNAWSEAIGHHRAGRLDEAIAAYRRMLGLAPDSAEAHNNLAMALRQSGRLEEAVREHQAAIAIRPAVAELHNNLGLTLKDGGQIDAAIAAYRQAVALKGDMAETWLNLGLAWVQKREFGQAIGAFGRAVAISPAMIDAQNNLGGALLELRRFDEAVPVLRRALGQDPNYVPALVNMGKAQLERGEYKEAIASYRRALALAPQLAEVPGDLAVALAEDGQVAEAEGLCREVIGRQPNSSRAHKNLGIVLGKARRHDEAIAAYRRAIELQADYAFAHWSLANELLTFGDYEHGWVEYEWRRRVLSLAPLRSYAGPHWDGGELGGKKIFLHAGHGLGDSIQFVRYLPMVARRGGRIILQCQPALRRLFSRLSDRVASEGEEVGEYDVQCWLMSMPRIFGTRVETIPAEVPYLHADADLRRTWGERLAGMDGVRVGLVWGGKRRPDPRRSAKLRELTALGDVKGVNFVSLQVGSQREELADAPREMVIADFMDQVQDFADTAALVANLDLVITIDTAMAHLAGAMGKTVWVMLPYQGAWLWLLDRDDSPWYPTMRLFRQSSPGDWAGVAERVARALGEFRSK